jgi:hypothetical protein
MGGVVSDIGELGQGAIDTVSDIGVSIDQGVRDTLGPNGWTLAALMAAGYYYAPEIGAYVNASGSTVPASAVVDAGVVSSPVTTGSVIATELPAFGTTAAGSAAGTALANAAAPAVTGTTAAVTPAVTGGDFLSGMGQVTATEGAGVSGTGILSGVPATTGGSNLIGSALNWATASPQNALTAAGLGLTAAKALGGGTTSTSSSSVDPDVKAAYLRNLEEARATAAGLGQKQFAAFPEYNLGMVQKYMNPYENQVVQNAMADIERQRQGQISAEGAAATAAKAFGGTRQAVTRSLVDEAALRNAGTLAAQLRQTGFSQAQNLGLSQEALRQQYEQSKLDAARNLGLERLGVSQGALSLQPTAGTQSAPLYTNPTASALGGALGGAKLGSLIGGEKNPEYAAYGAGLGGLLGFM